jgi:hypothetical protein
MEPGIQVQRVVRAPQGIEETLAFIGLGSQVTRAALVSTLATSIAYASKWPRAAFTPKGKLKKFSTAPVDPSYGEAETTMTHFVLVPVVAFALAYVFF